MVFISTISINKTDNSIRNNKTSIKYQQRIRPLLFNTPQTYTLNFNNKLEKGSISSSSFITPNGNTYSLIDDSENNIKAARTTNGIVDSPKEYMIQSDGSTNQGTIDYDTGKIVLNSMTVSSITDDTDTIRFNASPEINNSDVSPLREQILTYDSTDPSSITINMIAETII